MGVPKFYRWLSERYPKINQRLGRVALTETIVEHFGVDHPIANVAAHTNHNTNSSNNSNAITATPLLQPDPLSTCSTVPPIDRLYIDMNGIIHGCSHSNNGNADDDSETAVVGITEQEIFTNVSFYLDRVVRDIAQPTSLVYMAIDGVAPRAKLNQQRSRRYRSGKEGLIEQTIYDAHLQQIKTETASASAAASATGGGARRMNDGADGNLFMEIGPDDRDAFNEKDGSVKEIEPGRFAGKFLAHLDFLDDDRKGNANEHDSSSASLHHGSSGRKKETSQNVFHSNNITPGTPFFSRCKAHIEHFLQRKVSEDPAWQKLTIIFSGPNVPGEGEHKIMQFMREQQCAYEAAQQKSCGDATGESSNEVDLVANPLAYHPNLRHCIMGQDGDLIMLGLLTHEPNVVLLREQVSYDMKLKQQTASTSAALQSYILNPNFELLHMNVLRDYFSYEFETSNVIPDSPWSLEHCIDDFILMSFFVGNDFLPHMPAVDIADEAFDLLFYTYREQRKRWLKEVNTDKRSFIPYLIDKGKIVSGQRLEKFLQVLGKHETPYLEFKKSTDDTTKARQLEAKYGMSTIPSDYAKAAKEAADRALFRKRIVQQVGTGDGDSLADEEIIVDDMSHNERSSHHTNQYPDFRPVLTAATQLPNKASKKRSQDDEVGDVEALSERMGGLLRYTVKGGKDINISEEDVKGRYYSDKFGFSPFDAESHVALRKSYVEGLVWNLKYYYEGCPSWEWFYPYHYGPMLSDLVGIDTMLQEISLEGKLGTPLRPFEQLMACMPPSHAEVLPEPYRAFMTDPASTISDFYPQSFTIDMNGKRWPWEAVVLLPFIETKRLLEAVRTIDESQLTEEERKRNQFGGIVVFSRDSSTCRHVEAVGNGRMFDAMISCATVSTPFEDTSLNVSEWIEMPVFAPRLLKGVNTPLPGFPTLRDGTVQGLWRKLLRVNVHGSKSRYKTACLEIENSIPEVIPTDVLAEHLIGTLLWINYPHFVEAFVTAVSDSKGIIRGQSSRKMWSGEDLTRRKRRLSRIVSNYVFGERMVGTGGVALIGGEEAMEHLDVLLYVRPFSGTKTMEDGTVVKTFAKFEIEVPLFVTGWVPQGVDPRLVSLPVRLEKDPYRAAKYVLTDSRSDDRQQPSLVKSTLSHIGESRFYPAQRASGFHTLRGSTKLNPTEVSLVFRSNGSAFPGKSVAFSQLATGQVRSYCHESTLLTSGCVRGIMTKQPTLKNLRTSISLVHPPNRVLARKSKGQVFAFGIAVVASYFAGTQAVDFGCNNAASSIPRSHALLSHSTRNTCFSGFDDTMNPLIENGLTPSIEFAHGTTTISFIFQGGIIVAVDSRASLGNFVGSKTTQKVLPINTHVLGTMAGGAADCMIWIRKLRFEAAFHALTEGHRMSVAQTSQLLSKALYEYRRSNLSIATMIMGFDDVGDSRTSLPKIYYVDSSGRRIEGEIFAAGSGSTLALGILDAGRRYTMSTDEAVALGIRAIRHATLRDAFSGGFINVYLITARDGWTRVFAEDLDEMISPNARN